MSDLHREDSGVEQVLRWTQHGRPRSLVCTGRRFTLREGRRERACASHPWAAVSSVSVVPDGGAASVLLRTVDGDVCVARGVDGVLATELAEACEQRRSAACRPGSPISAARIPYARSGPSTVRGGWHPPRPRVADRKATEPRARSSWPSAFRPTPVDLRPVRINARIDGLRVRGSAVPRVYRAGAAALRGRLAALAALALTCFYAGSIAGLLIGQLLGLSVLPLVRPEILLSVAILAGGPALLVALLALLFIGTWRGWGHAGVVGVDARGIAAGDRRVSWDQVVDIEVEPVETRRAFSLYEARVVVRTEDEPMVLTEPLGLAEAHELADAIRAGMPSADAEDDPHAAARLADLAAIREHALGAPDSPAG